MIRATLLTLATISILPAQPRTILWAWERQTDLRFLDSKPAIGVAFYFAEIHLTRPGTVEPVPRRQPLLLSPKTYRFPVVRIDAEPGTPLTPAQRATLVTMLEEAVRIPHAPALQLDFDAPKSAWPFYRALLTDLRHRLGPRIFLSMTALVSWCGPGSWLTNLPVDEIVPMTFRMGYPQPPIPTDFANPACRNSLGLELPLPKQIPHPTRLYLFPGYHPWTPQLLPSNF